MLRIGTGHAVREERQWKTGIRVLGVAESFERSDLNSTVVGVVMRGDMRIDGMAFCTPRVGGLDSTDRLLEMYERLHRSDIRLWLLSGGVISWFNIVDLGRLYHETSIPVISVSYDDSEGLDKYLREYFPADWTQRVLTLEKNGPRHRVSLQTGHEVYVNLAGIDDRDAKAILDRFTLDGKTAEPLRVARIVAFALRRDLRPEVSGQ
ncbi:MAG: DUF99 family protein [Candidatus Thorarchaeota archaeon]|nr:DUF99 family protein [Candidatus Thorarchaeota archaeon]